MKKEERKNKRIKKIKNQKAWKLMKKYEKETPVYGFNINRRPLKLFCLKNPI